MIKKITATLDDGYKAMAADEEREKDAMEWCNALAGDMVGEATSWRSHQKELTDCS